jgi:hypothetical protein
MAQITTRTEREAPRSAFSHFQTATTIYGSRGSKCRGEELDDLLIGDCQGVKKLDLQLISGLKVLN